MLPLIAWRNIWRNKLRSLVVMTAIALGLWAAIFSASLGNGVNQGRIDSMIQSQVSHIQIHQPGFTENFETNLYVPNAASITQVIDAVSEVSAYTVRSIATGVVSSASAGQGVKIFGVDPQLENSVSDMANKLVEGKYFEGMKRNPIVVGRALAEELNLGLRKKVVLNFQNSQSEIVSATFRVCGIYNTNDARNDLLAVYVRKSDLDGLLELKDTFHEMAIITENKDDVDAIMPGIRAKMEGLSVESWKDIMPWLESVDIIGERGNYLLLLIILLALSFGIVNTMLMSVLERVREFGMLLAVGMNKTRLFLMIFLETTFLMLTATPFGILFGYLTVQYFKRYGLDLSAYSDGLQNVGLNPVIYPYLKTSFFFTVIALVIVAAFLAALYPARRALKLNPAEALRKI